MNRKNVHPLCVISLRTTSCTRYGGFDEICGRWELPVADDVYSRYGSGSNIGVQTFKVHRLAILITSLHIYLLYYFNIACTFCLSSYYWVKYWLSFFYLDW